MRAMTILLLLVALGSELCAGLLDQPLAVNVARLLSCGSFVASMIVYAMGLPRRLDAMQGAPGAPSGDETSALSIRG